MKTKAFLFSLTIFFGWNAHASSSQVIRLAGTVSPRVDQAYRLEGHQIIVTPEKVPELKITVTPIKKRLPASPEVGRLISTQRFDEPVQIVIEAP